MFAYDIAQVPRQQLHIIVLLSVINWTNFLYAHRYMCNLNCMHTIGTVIQSQQRSYSFSLSLSLRADLSHKHSPLNWHQSDNENKIPKIKYAFT